MKKTKKWVWLRRIRIAVQAMTLILFVLLITAAPMQEIFFRLNPLIGIGAILASRSFILKLIPSVSLLVLTFAFGRFWCGWLCPMGTVLDLFKLNRDKKTQKRGTQKSRRWITRPFISSQKKKLGKIKYILLFLIFGGALLGNLTLMIFDPITILTRTMTVTLLPAINHTITSVEIFAYDSGLFTGAVDAFETLVRGKILPVNLSYFNLNVLIGVLLIAIVLMNLAAHRFWCRYVCPFGALLGLISRFSLYRRSVRTECSGCDLCDKTCRVGAIDRENGYRSDGAECILCLDCFTTCPQNSTTYKLQYDRRLKKIEPSLAGQKYDPDRRSFLLSIGAAAVSVVLFRGEAAHANTDAYLIRPPGALAEDKFLSRCFRCGQCMRVCPTSGLQLSRMEGGIQGIWTPRLVPRLGYCDYNCNKCGQVCPSNAIQFVPIEKKRELAMGMASIDRGRCIAWAYDKDCMICIEWCPLPKKAVQKKSLIETTKEGEKISSHGPYVIEERCIGCGICEHKCPVKGTAAIRVARI